MKKALTFAIFVVLAVVSAISQQPTDKPQRPSPPGSADCKFADGNTLHVDYSRPYMKGRKVYGGLVPYDKVWRTGANEATTFVTSGDVKVGDLFVPKGSYTMFTVPSENKDSWKIIINKKTGEWGINGQEGYTYSDTELGRADMKTERIEVPVEQFSISFMTKPPDPNTCTLRLDWEKTRAYVDISNKP